MATNTRDKRASVLRHSQAWMGVLPSPESGVNAGDRAELALTYRNFLDGTKLYLRNTQVNAIGSTYYDMVLEAGTSADTAVVNATAAGTEIQFTKTAGGSLVQWVSGGAPVGGFTLTSLNLSEWFKESLSTVNVGGRVRVFKRTAAGVETELSGVWDSGTWDGGGWDGGFDNAAEFTTSDVEYTWTANVEDTAFAEDDRILVKFYIVNIGTMDVGTATLTFNAAVNSTGDSFVEVFPQVTFKIDSSGLTYSMLERFQPRGLMRGVFGGH